MEYFDVFLKRGYPITNKVNVIQKKLGSFLDSEAKSNLKSVKYNSTKTVFPSVVYLILFLSVHYDVCQSLMIIICFYQSQCLIIYLFMSVDLFLRQYLPMSY